MANLLKKQGTIDVALAPEVCAVKVEGSESQHKGQTAIVPHPHGTQVAFEELYRGLYFSDDVKGGHLDKAKGIDRKEARKGLLPRAWSLQQGTPQRGEAIGCDGDHHQMGGHEQGQRRRAEL